MNWMHQPYGYDEEELLDGKSEGGKSNAQSEVMCGKIKKMVKVNYCIFMAVRHATSCQCILDGQFCHLYKP